MLSRKLLVRPEAEADIADAYNWYRVQGAGLSSEFLRAVDACLSSIEREPLAYAIVHKQVRRALLRRFPYSIFFRFEQLDEESERVIVLS